MDSNAVSLLKKLPQPQKLWTIGKLLFEKKSQHQQRKHLRFSQVVETKCQKSPTSKMTEDNDGNDGDDDDSKHQKSWSKVRISPTNLFPCLEVS